MLYPLCDSWPIQAAFGRPLTGGSSNSCFFKGSTLTIRGMGLWKHPFFGFPGCKENLLESSMLVVAGSMVSCIASKQQTRGSSPVSWESPANFSEVWVSPAFFDPLAPSTAGYDVREPTTFGTRRSGISLEANRFAPWETGIQSPRFLMVFHTTNWWFNYIYFLGCYI